MTKRLDEFRKELQNSVSFIEQKLDSIYSDSDNTLLKNLTENVSLHTNDLLDCEHKESKDKPKLRLLHHLACSGGSLITKCFAALPNTFVLSEVHPHSYRHLPNGVATFLPSDIATLASQANFPESRELAQRIFKNAIDLTFEHIRSNGGTLVLRDHSHSDYCVGSNYTDNSTVKSVLSSSFDILSLVTVRNPIDCFASLLSNHWLHFSPQTFDEYCFRVLMFLKPYGEKQIFYYEDFTTEPIKTMASMCEQLEITFDESFIDTFDQFLVTGDSGRTGQTIESRPRRAINDEFRKEIKASKNFKRLCKQYKFQSKV